MFKIIISLAFLGDLQIYTFLETVLYWLSENQCFQFARCIYVGYLGFSKWPPNISAYRWHGVMILKAKPTFSGTGNLMEPSTMRYEQR